MTMQKRSNKQRDKIRSLDLKSRQSTNESIQDHRGIRPSDSILFPLLICKVISGPISSGAGMLADGKTGRKFPVDDFSSVHARLMYVCNGGG